jgi:hypothetical protein
MDMVLGVGVSEWVQNERRPLVVLVLVFLEEAVV